MQDSIDRTFYRDGYDKGYKEGYLIGHSDGLAEAVNNDPSFYKVLKREHLLLQELFPDDELPLVLWDEAGLSCNQYSYDDPNVVSENINDSWQCVEVFIRLFRHFYGDRGDNVRLYVTDQATGDICIALRRRFGFIDNLSGFGRWLLVLPFYKVNVTRLFMAEDSVQNNNSLQIGKEIKEKYYFGWLPYRWMSVKHYDSHCFKPARTLGFAREVSFDCWSDSERLQDQTQPSLFAYSAGTLAYFLRQCSHHR